MKRQFAVFFEDFFLSSNLCFVESTEFSITDGAEDCSTFVSFTLFLNAKEIQKAVINVSVIKDIKNNLFIITVLLKKFEDYYTTKYSVSFSAKKTV